MHKVTHILITGTFGLGCFGLWLLLGVLQNIYDHHVGQALPGLTLFCVAHRQWFLLLPLPFIVFTALSLVRRTASVEGVVLYLSASALLFVILFFTVALGALLPWFTIKGYIGG